MEIKTQKLVYFKLDNGIEFNFDLSNEDHKKILKEMFEQTKDDLGLVTKEIQYVPYQTWLPPKVDYTRPEWYAYDSTSKGAVFNCCTKK